MKLNLSCIDDKMNLDSKKRFSLQNRMALKKEGLKQRISDYFRSKAKYISKHCMQADKHNIALAITSGIFIGIIPFFGVPLILATAFGLAFRLNQVILQSVHFLVAPLQVLLFYPFITAGKWVFGLHETLGISLKEVPAFIYSNTGEFFQHYLKVFLAGTAIWLVVSVLVGFGLYKYIKWFLEKKMKKVIV